MQKIEEKFAELLENRQFPKDAEENLKFRYWLLDLAENDTRIQEQLFALCRDDIVFFSGVFCWTYNPKKSPSDLPFILYDFQEDAIKKMQFCIENGKDLMAEKTREMGWSWLMVLIQLHSFLFKSWSSLYGSYKEDYVDENGNMDSHFERIRYTLGLLPEWIKPSDLFSKYMLISSKERNAEIAGDTGQNFGTGGRRKFVILDEFSYWQFDANAFRKTADIANCRIFGGTPNGKFNVYGKINTGHEDYSHLNIERLRLHWRQHPDKTQEWYNEEMKRRTPEDMARELDISYSSSVKGAVYPRFSKIVNIGKYEYDPRYRIYTSWDFGRDMTAIIWWQWIEDIGKLRIFECYQKSAQKASEPIDIDFFAAFITGVPTQGFTYSEKELKLIERNAEYTRKYEYHCGDPYNTESKQINSLSSIKDRLSSFGVHILINAVRSTLVERITKARLKLVDIQINEKCVELIDAMEQSRYPEVSERAQITSEKLKPVHDESSHFRTAFEYFIDFFRKPDPKKAEMRKNRLKKSIQNSREKKKTFKLLI